MIYKENGYKSSDSNKSTRLYWKEQMHSGFNLVCSLRDFFSEDMNFPLLNKTKNIWKINSKINFQIIYVLMHSSQNFTQHLLFFAVVIIFFFFFNFQPIYFLLWEHRESITLYHFLHYIKFDHHFRYQTFMQKWFCFPNCLK